MSKHSNEIELQAKPSEASSSDKPERIPDSKGLTSAEAAELLIKFGRNELPEKIVPKWYIFCSQLWQPMPLMIWVAAIVEGALENWPDMSILFGILFANASLSYYEITKAGNAVKALKASLKPEATCKRDGKWANIDAATLVPGDLVLLACGSTVPADCFVNKGQKDIDVDQAALTGESLPVKMRPTDLAKMGSMVVKGEAEGTVEFTGNNTFFGKTAELLNQTDEQSNLQKMIIRVMLVLVALSLTLCIVVFIYLMLNGLDVRSALSFTVVLLVASIPIAIEIVCTTTLALGSKQLAHHGAIVTRLSAIEDLAGISILCSDKTGTLTMNKMMIQPNPLVYHEGETQHSLLRYAAMATKWHEPPRDALDTMVLTQADLHSLENVKQLDYMPFDPTVKRTAGAVETATGERFRITKGAPHIISKLTNDPELEKKVHDDVEVLGASGTRCLAIAKSVIDDQLNDVSWTFLGLLSFLDPERPDSKDTIEKALDNGVEVKMITGDHLLIAKEMSRRLGLGQNILTNHDLPLLGPDRKAPKDLLKNYGYTILHTDGFAQVFPEHKFLIVECLRQMGFKIGMTGDGVNDAPALSRADVGIAVEGATDAARAAADIVLTQPGLGTVIHCLILSRCIFERIKTFLTYRIAATMQLLVFFFIAVLAIHPDHYMPDPKPANWPADEEDWPEFFQLPVLMLMLITLLNDGTLISIGYDNVVPSPSPQIWNLRRIFLISSSLGAVACLSSLIMLYIALDSWNPEGIMHKWGLGEIRYGQIITMMYLKISVSDFLTLFCSRCHFGPFWHARPALMLFLGAMTALTLSTIISLFWMKSKPDHIRTEGMNENQPHTLPLFVWLYSVVWWFIQDAVKLTVYHSIVKFDLCGGSKVIVPQAPLTPKAKSHWASPKFAPGSPQHAETSKTGASKLPAPEKLKI